jgi:hypothetical protein
LARFTFLRDLILLKRAALLLTLDIEVSNLDQEY